MAELNTSLLEINLERMENGFPPIEGWEIWGEHQKPASPEQEEALNKLMEFTKLQMRLEEE